MSGMRNGWHHVNGDGRQVAPWRSFIIGGVIAASILMPTGIHGGAASASAGCDAIWHQRRTAPDVIRVWVPHLHKIWRPAFREYVLRVMSAGAAPGYLPLESMKVMAFGIAQYATWEMLHPSEDKRKRAGCYDIQNGGSEGQYVWPYSGLRPYTKRQEEAVDAVLGWSAWKFGRYFRLGWRDGYGRKCGDPRSIDRWHLPEDEITACAKKGWGWKRIVKVYLAPVRLVPPKEKQWR